MVKSSSRVIFVVIILLFLTSYIIATSSYYEYVNRDKNVISSERIKEFEEDIKNNKEIDLKNYMINEKEDYSNKITDIVYGISDISDSTTKKIIKYLFRKVSSLME